ncbi:hypothetical protein SDC9_158692 [bioreactor metagenome]|uniref:Uncharacterized protein n=1 Tax=bioreactor metagenome TaxID=1076179 RepID=A0A645FAQ9_9ZZZZ
MPHRVVGLPRQLHINMIKRFRVVAPALSGEVHDRFATRQRLRQPFRFKIATDNFHRLETGFPVDSRAQCPAEKPGRAGDCDAADHFFFPSFFSAGSAVAATAFLRSGMNSMKSISARLVEPEYWLFAPTLMMNSSFGIFPNAFR